MIQHKQKLRKMGSLKTLLFLSFALLLLLDVMQECQAINLFISQAQAEAFVGDTSVNGPTGSDQTPSTTEEIGVSVRPGEVEKEIQEEFIEDNADPQEAALETEERTREKTEL